MLKNVLLFKGYPGQLPYTIEYWTLEEIATANPEVVGTWYQTVKEKIDRLFTELHPRLCLVCGDVIGREWDAHHGIVSRNDVRGWRHAAGDYDSRIVKRLLIDTELNLVPLHHSCHLQRPPSREECWNFLTNLYTEEAVREWYESLPWKKGMVPRRF